jgi:4-diphosphocytidyl-2-C-methyl-D-erythritol kinase
VLCFPNAKINIGLNIVAKRSDGFHNIETLFYPIPLSDGLEIVESNSTERYQFTSSGIPIHIDDKENIVCKAFELIHSRYPIPPTKIHLHKNIPFGAGLGGGSADAAFMIRMLNELYQLNISNLEMEKLAGQLGSDCPFFIANQAVFAEGKGDVFTACQIDLSGYFILLVKPDIHIGTPEAYANTKPGIPKQSLKLVGSEPMENWKHFVFNDFENSIFPNHPILEKIKSDLYEMGAVYASMSGSGSSLFGLFKEKPPKPEKWKEHFCWVHKLD